jgi:DNA-binding CsgD family transcriptional regulator
MAFVLAHMGRLSDAQKSLTQVAHMVARPPHHANSGYITIILEAAALAGDRSMGPRLFELIRGDDRRLPLMFVFVPRHLAALARLLGDFQASRDLYHEGITVAESIGHRPELALSRLELADLLLNSYPSERARAFEQLDLAIPEFESMEMKPALARALHLRGVRRTGSEPAAPAFPDGLSAREVEVLRLIVQGKSNQQIADELVISYNTAIRHVTHIFSKTGAANRAEAVDYAHRKRLLEDLRTSD